ncbi:protein TASOR isoform X1 [Pimephales promelas]|uniref:protein TASOR isoform X1 n=1 Tax=Pimephales promelas TaxID=90988 RepID=UPI001955D9CE|nr:protein TASOR isoform X1 [Pimephales promelas]
MEHRGGKTSDKEKHDPAAPSWSQNGGPEEECGYPDGPDEEKRLKRVSRAAKPAEEQPRLNFHIPRKSREKRALFQHVSLESREFSEIQQILTSSYKDSSSAGTFLYSKPRLVHNDPLEKDFMEKRRELKLDGRTEKELSESFCFLLCDAQKVSVVCERGLSVGSSWMNMLGNPAKGVYLCQFSDLLQITPIEPGSTGNIVIFKVIKGKVKSVHDCMSRCIDPTPKFDSHFSKNSTRVTSLQAYRSFEYTQQYFYEYVDFEISSRPRHVCPYAVVSYSFKSRETSTAVPKPLAPLRTSSQPSGTSRGRRSYTVWRGHFVNQGRDMYQACLRSLSRPFLPYKLPEKIEVGTVMRLQQVKQKMSPALFSWSIYTGSHEVCKNGMVCCLFDVVEKDKSLSALLQTLEEQGLVLVNMVKDRGFLFLLSSSQMANSSERRGGWKMSCIQALFIYREKRELLKSPAPCRPASSERWGPVMPQHDSFVSALHLALSKARADPPADPSACVQQSVCEYLTHLRLGKPMQRVRTDYDPKLDVREKLFPAPRQKPSIEPFLRPYIYSPGLFTLGLHGLKAEVEELVHAGTAQENPERVQELLELIQLNKKSSQGGAGAEAAEKRKGELHAAEGAAKRLRSKPSDELAEAADERESAPHLSDVLSSVGLQDTDLRKDKSQSALKVMQMLESFGKTSLDTDLRKDKSHGALEVIKLIDTLTRASSESPADSELKEADDISDTALFDSMLRLGLPTDRDIDLRKRFIHDDEPGRTDGLEEETAGSLSSLEAFSPCSDSGGQQRGVNLLGEKTIPWVLIPITGLKTERYSQRQMDYPEDPRFVQSPVVSTHTTPDKKELSPAYQPDSSNTACDLEDPADAAEEDEPVPAAAGAESHTPADPALGPGGVDLIVDEQISGFSCEVEQLLRNSHIYYVSSLSALGSRGPLKTPVLPLSDYISNFHTPFPVTNYISSFQDSLKEFIDSQSASGARSAQELVSSSTSAPEVTSNVPDTSSSIYPCASSPSTTTFESFLRPCSPSSALPDSLTPHHPGDVHEPPRTLWPQDSESQTQEANSTSALAEMNGGPETTEMAHTHTDDVPMAHVHTLPEDVPMERAHTLTEEIPMEHALSSIIHQLQPEVISNLVEILKGVQKNSVHFYIHSTNEEEESDVCWEIKEYLKKLGDLECNPQAFLEKSNSQDKLLVIIPNMDIATQVHKIPSLVALKKHPSVSFAGVDNLSDIQNHTYNELFQSGGFIVSDEHVLNPAVITAEKLRDILEHIERLNSPQSPWRWRIHFKSHKKLREHSRLKVDALNLYEILTAYEKRHIVEILSYHECDAPSRRAPDLGCLVDLQARFVKQRHLIFLTGFQFEMFPQYSSSGIIIANVDDVKFVISSLASGEAVASVPPVETYPTPDPASLRDDSMSMDSDQDSSGNTQLSHVVTDHQPSPFPPASEPALHQHPADTETSDTPKELDFKALSEAISQFKASRMLAQCDAGDALETSFRVDTHQSFLGDLCDFSSDTHDPPPEPAAPAPSRVEASADADHQGGSVCVLTPAAPIPENNNPDPAAQTSPIPVIDTRSGMTARKAEGGQASSVLGTPPISFLSTPRYGMGGFYPGLQGSGFMSATHQAMMGFASGFGHPLLNCTVSNGLGVVGPPAWRGLLPNNSVPMAWHSSAQGSLSPGLWAARFGSNVQQIQSAPFLQNWQRDAHRPDGGGFGSW